MTFLYLKQGAEEPEVFTLHDYDEDCGGRLDKDSTLNDLQMASIKVKWPGADGYAPVAFRSDGLSLDLFKANTKNTALPVMQGKGAVSGGGGSGDGGGPAGVAPTGRAGGAGLAVMDRPMIITFHKGDKPEAKASKDTRATFETSPVWVELCHRVESIFPDMAAEAYSLQWNGMDLSENLWPRAVLPQKPPAGAIQVSLKVIGKCRAFSSFKREEAWQLLHTTMQHIPEKADCFPMDDDVPEAALDEKLQSVLPMKTQADIIALLGQELALRCCKTDPKKHSKEASKRQLISPVIYTAAALAGEGVSVEEERSVCGAYGKGSIDFIIEFDGFDIVVLEGKLHETLDEHLGQLAAEMRSAREQYTRTHLGKRKFDDEGDFKQVPSFGILSNGTTYNFYKYMVQERSLVQFTARASLDKGVTAEAAGKAVLPILLRLVKVIKEQMGEMRKFKKAKHGDS